MISAQERRAQLKKRTQEAVANKGGRGGGILDLSKFDNVKWFTPTKKNYILDILPYIIKTDNHPQKIGKDLLDYKLDVFVHFAIGPQEKSVVCLAETFNRPCPICEEIKTIEDEKLKQQLKAKRRTIFNVIDVNSNPDEILLWDVSYHLFEKELLDEVESQEAEVGVPVIFSDLEEGRSVECRFADEKYQGRAYLKPKNIRVIEREPYDESVLSRTYPLDEMLVIPSYEEVKSLFFGEEAGEHHTTEKKEEKEPIQRGSKQQIENMESTKTPPVRKGTTQTTNKMETPATPLKRERKTQQVKEENKCPSGHTFGKSCNSTEECVDCPEAIFEECSIQYDQINQ